MTNEFIVDEPIKLNDYFSNLTQLRLLFHTHVYNDITNIELLKTAISNHVDTISIDYDDLQKVFSIKIKKTTMKKDNKFEHNVFYYYNIFENIFLEFLLHNAHMLNTFLKDTMYLSVDNILQNIKSLSTMYNIACVSDNIIVLYV